MMFNIKHKINVKQFNDMMVVVTGEHGKHQFSINYFVLD